MRKLLSIVLISVLILSVSGCAINTQNISDIAPAHTAIYNEASEKNINFPECLSYGDSQWREIEENFKEDVLSRLSSEYKIYDSSELSAEILEKCNDVVIVERCIGIVVDKETGDGKVLNPYNDKYDFISYRSTDQKYYDGTIFVSYLIYNNKNNRADIAERYDFVLCREYEN